MNSLRSHQDLDVWKLSMDFAIAVYQITEKFPAHEKYGLSLQIRRAAVSVPSNIAEGAGRSHSKEFVQFLFISLGSLAEIETQLQIAERLGYTHLPESLKDMTGRIRKMLIGLIKRVTRDAKVINTGITFS